MFKFKLVDAIGATVIDRFEAATPTWRAGDRVFLNPTLIYRVTAVEDGDDDLLAVLIVERDE